MSSITRTATLPDSSNKADFYALIDSSTVGSIVAADITDSTITYGKLAGSIPDSKLNTISTAGKVSGAALTSLASIPAGAGLIPSANLGAVFPSGLICLWSGSIATIPSGWYLCDGNNSTPDLRDRFVIGAGSTYAVAATGGGATKNLAHTHSVPHDGWSQSVGVSDGHLAVRSDGGGGSLYLATADQNSGSGGSATQDVLNPYYALAYIMKS